VVWLKNGGDVWIPEVWCDGWGMQELMCSGPCTSIRPACSHIWMSCMPRPNR